MHCWLIVNCLSLANKPGDKAIKSFVCSRCVYVRLITKLSCVLSSVEIMDEFRYLADMYVVAIPSGSCLGAFFEIWLMLE